MQILVALKDKIPPSLYDTWLRPTQFDHSRGKALFLRVPNEEFVDITERFGNEIKEAIEGLRLPYIEIGFVTEQATHRKAEH